MALEYEANVNLYALLYEFISDESHFTWPFCYTNDSIFIAIIDLQLFNLWVPGF